MFSRGSAVLGLRGQAGRFLHDRRSCLRRRALLRSGLRPSICFFIFIYCIYICICSCFNQLFSFVVSRCCAMLTSAQMAHLLRRRHARFSNALCRCSSIGTRSRTHRFASLFIEHQSVSVTSLTAVLYSTCCQSSHSQYEIAVVSSREARIDGPFELRTDWTVAQYADPEATPITLDQI